MAYLDNTVYTTHALTKIGRNLIGDYENFNFLRIRIGSGDNTLSEYRTNLSSLLYTLKIKNISYEDGVITIICDIPPELADVPITEIGLFDTVLGVDYLFSYSKVDITKPADLGYELTIVLNLGPKTIDFPGVNVFEVPEEEYATASSLDGLREMFIYVDTNLERVIHSNAQVIGYNLPEVAFEKKVTLNNVLRNNTYANLYYSLYGIYGSDLTDMYFIHEPNYLSYDLINFAKEDSRLITYDKLFDSYHDGLSFHDAVYDSEGKIDHYKPITLAWMMKFDDTGVDSTILNKRNDVNLYFSMETTQNYEIWKTELDKSGNPVHYRALYDELLITLYGVSSTYTIKYIFDGAHKGNYTGQYLPYILVFNGDFDNPEFSFYVDGEQPSTYDEPDMNESEEVMEARSETDPYGKIIWGNNSALVDMPNYSYCTLKNYLVDDEGTKYNYDNATDINALWILKKQATKHDVAFLSSVMRSLGEFD